MKIKFRNIHLSTKNKLKLETVNSIIEEYQEQGYVLTLRQLYYQLVSRNIIPNKQIEYTKLSRLLKEGRMSGIVDWEAIEDRIRQPYIPYFVSGIEEAISDTIAQYRLNLQYGQNKYIEVWVEKDALSGVLRRITSKYHIRLLINRGYGSVSSMFDAHKRFENCSRSIVYVLYLGDYDPSGQDMIRDIKERIKEFNQQGSYEFNIIPVALTWEQIQVYNPPPNPAKLGDPRAKKYIKDKGNMSWEVDALKPEVLNRLLTESIELLIDMDKYNQQLQKQVQDIQKLKSTFKQ